MSYQERKSRVLGLWRRISRKFNAAFHSQATDRIEQMRYHFSLLQRIEPIMVRYGHLHPDCLKRHEQRRVESKRTRKEKTR